MTIILCVTFRDGVTIFQRVKKATDHLHTLSCPSASSSPASPFTTEVSTWSTIFRTNGEASFAHADVDPGTARARTSARS